MTTPARSTERRQTSDTSRSGSAPAAATHTSQAHACLVWFRVRSGYCRPGRLTSWGLGNRAGMSEMAGGPVPTYAIKVQLNRSPSDSEIETLRTRTADVCVERDGAQAMLRFSREAETLSVAVAEALEDVATVPGLQVLWVHPDSSAA